MLTIDLKVNIAKWVAASAPSVKDAATQAIEKFLGDHLDQHSTKKRYELLAKRFKTQTA